MRERERARARGAAPCGNRGRRAPASRRRSWRPARPDRARASASSSVVRLRVVRRVVRLAGALQVGDAEIALRGARWRDAAASRLCSSLTCVASPVSDVTGSSVARTALGAACGAVESPPPRRPAETVRPRRRPLRCRARVPPVRAIVRVRPASSSSCYLLPELGLLRYGNALPNRPPLASFDGHAVGAELEQPRPGPLSGRFGPPSASSEYARWMPEGMRWSIGRPISAAISMSVTSSPSRRPFG